MADSTEEIVPADGASLVSRRTFLSGIGVAITGAAVYTVLDHNRLTLNSSLEEQLTTLQRSTFAKCIGDTFQVTLQPGRKVALRLTAVRDAYALAPGDTSKAAKARQQASFSVRFSGPSSSPLTQGSYTVSHGRIGTFALFVVPMTLADGRQGYEAIFNRQTA